MRANHEVADAMMAVISPGRLTEEERQSLKNQITQQLRVMNEEQFVANRKAVIEGFVETVNDYREGCSEGKRKFLMESGYLEAQSYELVLRVTTYADRNELEDWVQQELDGGMMDDGIEVAESNSCYVLTTTESGPGFGSGLEWWVHLPREKLVEAIEALAKQADLGDIGLRAALPTTMMDHLRELNA